MVAELDAEVVSPGDRDRGLVAGKRGVVASLEHRPGVIFRSPSVACGPTTPLPRSEREVSQEGRASGGRMVQAIAGP